MEQHRIPGRSLGEQDTDYLQDESKYKGAADSISFPKSRGEVSEIISDCIACQIPVTVQGALTGITGAAIPVKGHVMNMKNMNQILSVMEDGRPEAIVQAGVTIAQLEQEIRRVSNDRYFFPVVPTEKTATLGGMAASGSRGIQSYHYGGMKEYIKEIEFCDGKGALCHLKAEEPEFASYLPSEGMLGVITALTLNLVKKPKHQWGILFFFSNDRSACHFTDLAEEMEAISGIEYMDYPTVTCIAQYQKHMSAISELPRLPEWAKALIYIELEGDTEEEIEESAMILIEKCEESGGDPDTAWAMSGEVEMEGVRAYRHAASECVNMQVSENHGRDSRIRKISADITWKGKSRIEILEYYKVQLEEAGLYYGIFGHLGQRCPYVNIIARSIEEYEAGRMLLKKWEKEAYEEGGSIFTEHGAGKLKREDYGSIISIQEMNQHLKAKSRWDPEGIFNPGNRYPDHI